MESRQDTLLTFTIPLSILMSLLWSISTWTRSTPLHNAANLGKADPMSPPTLHHSQQPPQTSPRVTPSSRLFLLLALFLPSLHCHALPAHLKRAQESSFTPPTVVGPASAVSQGIWYIQGGYELFARSRAVYSLDLTAPWSTFSPPWVRLPEGPALSVSTIIVSTNNTFRFPGFDSKSSTVLSFLGSEDITDPFLALLELPSHTWTSNATKLQIAGRNQGLTPVGNPDDGKIYIRGGYQPIQHNTMDIYDPATDTLVSRTIPTAPNAGADLSQGGTGVHAAQWYNAVWSSKRHSILYFGGRIGTTSSYVPNAIYEYMPALDQWRVLLTTGAPPSAREDACMVTDVENNKVVVFGGQDGKTILGDIFVLDMTTLQWTAGGPGVEGGRVSMTCALHQDGFLAWGGCRDELLTNFHDPQPVFFNLTTNSWSSTYKMSGPDVTSPEVGKVNPGKNSSFELTLGLTVGVIGAIAIIVGILLYRREKKKTVRKYGPFNGVHPNNSRDKSTSYTNLQLVDRRPHGVDSVPGRGQEQLSKPKKAAHASRKTHRLQSPPAPRDVDDHKDGDRDDDDGEYGNVPPRPSFEGGTRESGHGSKSSRKTRPPSIGHKIEMVPGSTRAPRRKKPGPSNAHPLVPRPAPTLNPKHHQLPFNPGYGVQDRVDD